MNSNHPNIEDQNSFSASPPIWTGKTFFVLESIVEAWYGDLAPDARIWGLHISWAEVGEPDEWSLASLASDPSGGLMELLPACDAPIFTHDNAGNTITRCNLKDPFPDGAPGSFENRDFIEVLVEHGKNGGGFFQFRRICSINIDSGILGGQYVLPFVLRSKKSQLTTRVELTLQFDAAPEWTGPKSLQAIAKKVPWDNGGPDAWKFQQVYDWGPEATGGAMVYLPSMIKNVSGPFEIISVCANPEIKQVSDHHTTETCYFKDKWPDGSPNSYVNRDVFNLLIDRQHDVSSATMLRVISLELGGQIINTKSQWPIIIRSVRTGMTTPVTLDVFFEFPSEEEKRR